MLIALDTETTTDALKGNNFTLHCISIAWYEGGMHTRTYRTVEDFLAEWDVNEHRFVMFNAKFDRRVLKAKGLELPYWEDSMLLSYCVNTAPKIPQGAKSPHSLEAWGLRLGYHKIDFNDYNEYSEEMARYCERDAEITLLVWEKLASEYPTDYYYFIEKPFMSVVMIMERNGYYIDTAKLEEAKGVLEAELTETSDKLAELIDFSIPANIVKYKNPHPEKEEAGTHAYIESDETYHYYQRLVTFNPASTKHKAYVLEEHFGCELEETDKGNKIVDADALEALGNSEDEVRNEFIRLLLDQADKQKLLSTFVEGLLKALDSDGRVRANYNQTVTRTGRLSSSNPNLQNLPSKGEGGDLIRASIIAPEGKKIVCADVSQFQYRIAVHLLAQEYGLEREDVRHLVETYTTDGGSGDIHEANRSMLEAYCPDLFAGDDGRKTAKVYGFALLFGAQAEKISQISNLTVPQAKTVLEAGREQLHSFEDYKALIIERCKANKGILYDLFGRRLVYREIMSEDRKTRARAERQLFNAIVQGTEATIIKMMGLKLKHLLPKEVKLCGQVHDEFIVECPDSMVDSVIHTMEAVLSAEWLPSTREDVPTIPCLGEAHKAQNWNDAK